MNFFVISLVYFVATIVQGDDCSHCKNIVQKINETIFKTRTSSFSGGNADYEKKKLISYEISETRMNDIFEEVLKSAPSNPRIISQLEDRLEEWWSEHFIKDPKNFSFNLLQDSICLSSFCCPNEQFGKDCQPCQECNPIGGNCNGNGTRSGTGSCDCKTGYKGTTCNECQDEAGYFFHEKNDENWSTCSKCKPNCLKCTDADDCSECKKGFRINNESCYDIDECVEEEHCNEEGKFCKNTPGSFRCDTCDPACRDCKDETRFQCSSCNDGYELKGSTCTDINECELGTFECNSETEDCSNVDGSYECICKVDYHNPDGKGCVSKDTKDEL